MHINLITHTIIHNACILTTDLHKATNINNAQFLLSTWYDVLSINHLVE